PERTILEGHNVMHANRTVPKLQRPRHVLGDGIAARDPVQHHDASAGKRPLKQCRATGIRDVNRAAGEGEPAGNSSQGTGGKAYCSARWLTDTVNSKES